MNSSAGFKKRSLLRPPSGTLSQNRELLKVIDVSQSESILASNFRAEIAMIQEQINLLDKDKKIRSGQLSLQKKYILNIRKWVKQIQMIGNQKQDEDIKVLRYMGAENYQSGFRKLWKIMSNLDLMMTKITELQAVQFIKYDQHFENMETQSTNCQRILQSIAKGGFKPSNFYLSQLLLSREIQNCQLITTLKRSSTLSKTKQNTNQLIDSLKQQNTKLIELLDKFQTKQTIIKEQKQNIQPIAASQNKQDILAKIEAKYVEKINYLNTKIQTQQNQISEIQTLCSELTTKLKIADEQLTDKKLNWSNVKKESYQQALLEEMSKMKNGFERKIEVIMEESANKEKDMRKKWFMQKNDYERLKWENSFLLKKYQLLNSV